MLKVPKSAMSQQLQISSLASAFALVCLCLFARVGAADNAPLSTSEGPVVQMVSVVAKG